MTNYPPLSAGIGSEKAYYYTMLRLVTVNGLLQTSNSHYDTNYLKWQFDFPMRPDYERSLWKKCINL